MVDDRARVLYLDLQGLFLDLLRAAGGEDLPDDPTPADLPELMADADDGDLAVVRRLLGARDLADEWDDMGSDERTDGFEDLFGGVAARPNGRTRNWTTPRTRNQRTPRARTTTTATRGPSNAPTDSPSGDGDATRRFRRAGRT